MVVRRTTMVVFQTTIALCLTTTDRFRSNLVVRRLAIVRRQTTLCFCREAMVVRGQPLVSLSM
jgi:hypothetical protein